MAALDGHALGPVDTSGVYELPAGASYTIKTRTLHPGPFGLVEISNGTGAGVLVVATEEDEVYAFDEKTGAQIWMRSLGEPATLAAGFRCGNI